MLERALHEVHVRVVADVLAVRKQVLRKRSRLQLATQVLIAHLQIHPVRLMLQNRPLHQDLPRPRHHVRQQRVRQMLLLQLPLRQLVHLSRLDRRALAEDPRPAEPGSRTVAYTVRIVGRRVVEDSRAPA